MLLYVWATICGIIVFYEADRTTTDLTIFYFAWISTATAAFAEVGFLFFAIKMGMPSLK